MLPFGHIVFHCCESNDFQACRQCFRKCCKDVDEAKLKKAVKNKKIIIALGGFVERVCKKYSISNYKIDHPSPRNRNLNSKEYEQKMLDDLKCYLIMNKI